ncbi:hypothetical protein AN960_22295 [Bacillus sp. FJAT-25509]|nr:hypothetical protein AN960_22295 [Bacillus sp. FJAT-25509]
MRNLNKQKEKWNTIRSKGKKRYVLNIVFFYTGSWLLFTTFNLFVLNRVVLTYIPYVIFEYLIAIIFSTLMGLWIGNKTWNVNEKKFKQ